jgi:hypothetical protein
LLALIPGPRRGPGREHRAGGQRRLEAEEEKEEVGGAGGVVRRTLDPTLLWWKTDHTRGESTQTFLRRSIALAVAIAALATPPSADAATQIGQTLDPNVTCLAPRTFIQTNSPGAHYAAPLSGVITSWSYQAAASSPQIKFKVARPQGGNTFMIVGESDLKTPATGALNTYPIQISVQPGDVIGFYFATDGPCAQAPVGYDFHNFVGDPPPGTTAEFNGPFANGQLDVSAVLEPDCDGDGLGDETQDPELPLGEACGKGNRSVTLDANKNKVTKRKKVRLSGQVNATARQGPCETGQTVEVQRKRPKQTTFTTFATVQTDTQGSFSLKKRIKKTLELRAQVVETAACTGALSASEKVKVKKKKKK